MMASDYDPSRETAAEQATARLLDDLVAGVYAPGEKLQMERLKQRYAMGASPLREALARLVPLGFVIAESHRGFRAAPLSRADLQDLTMVRQMVESEALERTLARAGLEWEVELTAGLRRLALACEQPDVHEPAGQRQVEHAHWLLHRAIIAPCASPRLLELQERYYQQAWRYRRQIIGQPDLAGFVAEHERLVDTLLRRASEQAVDALRSHIALTLRDFRE